MGRRRNNNRWNGKYQITSFVPGEYYVKFIYPNGQDYKSTTYNYDKVNSGFDVNNPDREIGTLIEPTDVNYSDARDIWGDETTPGTRSYVNGQYSGKQMLQEQTNLQKD